MKEKQTLNLVFILFLLLTSCNPVPQEKNIEAVYFTGNPEFPIHVNERAVQQLNVESSETIKISRTDLEYIIKGLQNKKRLRVSGEITPLIYLKVDTLERFLGNGNYMTDINGIKYKEDDYFLYFVRSKIGYYDYLDKEDLAHRKEIQEYGIPSNYKDRFSDRNKPKKEVNKVFLMSRD
jgi:hypothetical protein